MKKILLCLLVICLFRVSPMNAQAMTFGYGAETGWSGLGLGSSGVKFDVAIFVPGNGTLKGAKIRGINIPVLDTGMTGVSVWLKNTLSGTKAAEAEATGKFVANKYFTVEFQEPVTIPEGGLYAGYSFTCSIAYPIAMAGEMASGALYLNYTNNGSVSGWDDYSTEYPPSPMQVLLEGVSLADYSVDLTYVGQSTRVANEAYSLPVSIVSNSANAIESLDLAVTVDGKTEQRHVALSLGSGLNQSATFAIAGTTPDEPGRYPVAVAVKKVNGERYEGDASATGMLKSLIRKVQRRTVIEEYTGTGCGYCPRGWVGMEYMKANYPDRFVGIAFHKYNSGDPMYYSNYPMLGLSGAPGCMIDRKEEADPYYGFTNGNYGIEDAFEELNKVLPEVEVGVEAQWNTGETAVEVNAEVEFLVTPGSVSLVYVLTADSLSGTTSAWKQSNYYYQYSKSQVGNALGIVDFCSGGKYGKSSVALTFNDVVIGSSYASGRNKGETLEGYEDVVTGSVYHGSYTITTPTKTTLKNAIKKHLVDAIVLVVDDETGEVLNAAKSRVSAADAIVDVAHTARNMVSARYNAAGQVISAPQRGLNIVRMTDGTVRKIMVK